MDIGYVWDERQYRKAQEEHNVAFAEVVSAFDDVRGFDTHQQTERWVWIGKTSGGRVLAIVWMDEDAPLYRIITAFDAEGRYLDEYHSRAR